MKATDLAAAERIYESIGRSDDLLKGLAGQLRVMGLVRTLEWLQQKTNEQGPRIAAELMRAVGLQDARQLETDSSRTRVLAWHRRAYALTEALHLIIRVKSEEGS